MTNGDKWKSWTGVRNRRMSSNDNAAVVLKTEHRAASQRPSREAYILNKNMRNLDNQMMLYFSDKSLIFKLYYYILIKWGENISKLLSIHWKLHPTLYTLTSPSPHTHTHNFTHSRIPTHANNNTQQTATDTWENIAAFVLLNATSLKICMNLHKYKQK